MSSSAIYTACDWQVDAGQLRCIWRLHEALVASGGALRIIPQVMWHERRLLVDRFVLKTYSHDTVETVKSLCQGKLVLNNWRDAAELDFEDELAFNPFAIPDYDRRTWEARVHMATEHNLRVYGPVVSRPYGPGKSSDWTERAASLMRRTNVKHLDNILDMLQRGPDALLAYIQEHQTEVDEMIEKLRTKSYHPPESPET